jgi:hypothetical protein
MDGFLKMKENNIIEQLLEIEEDPEILNFRFRLNNIPMWLFIRSYVFWQIIKNKYNLAEAHVKPDLKNLSFKEKITYLKNVVKKYPFKFNKKYKALIIDVDINNVKEGNFYVNRISDPIYSVYMEDAFYFENSSKLKFSGPRKFSTYSYDLFLILRKILRRSTIYDDNYDRVNIEKFVTYLKLRFEKNSFDLNQTLKENIRKQLNIISKNLKINKYFYNYLLEKIKPNVLFLEDAHELDCKDLIYYAKKSGIIVIEPQHGYVGKDHIAYNFNYKLFEYIKEYLPDYFLTFGKFWSDNIRTPSEKVEIGFPYLEEKVNMARQLKNQEIRDKRNILIISGGSLPEEYNNLIKNLYNLLDKNRFKIIFRPHPSERIALNERYKDIINMGVEIDLDNLYKSLIKYDIVLSFEKSTVLYEALAFGIKVILISYQKNDYYNKTNNIFLEIKYDVKSIVNLVENEYINYNLQNLEYVWKPNSKKNLIDFFKKLGIE